MSARVRNCKRESSKLREREREREVRAPLKEVCHESRRERMNRVCLPVLLFGASTWKGRTLSLQRFNTIACIATVIFSAARTSPLGRHSHEMVSKLTEHLTIQSNIKLSAYLTVLNNSVVAIADNKNRASFRRERVMERVLVVIRFLLSLNSTREREFQLEHFNTHG